MKNILPSRTGIFTVLLLSGFMSLTASCRRDQYVCECYSSVKGAMSNDLGGIKQDKAQDQCNYIYIHLKATDSSVYCQLVQPYKK